MTRHAILVALLASACTLRPALPAPREPLSATDPSALPDEPSARWPETSLALRLTRRDLANGMRVAIARSAPAGMVSVVFVSRATAGASPARSMVASCLAEALGERVTIDGAIVERPLDRDAFTPRIDALPEGLRITARFDRARLDRYLALLERVVAASQLDDPARCRERTIASLEGHGAIVARRSALRFDDEDPRAASLEQRLALARAIDVDALRARLVGLSDPRHAALVIAGDVDPNDALPLVVQRFAAWSASADDAPAPTAPRYRLGAARGLTVPTGSERAAIAIDTPAPGFTEPDYASFLVIEQLVGRMHSARLRLVLRERDAVAYAADAAFEANAADGQLRLLTEARAAHTREALRFMLGELGRVRDGEIEPLELELARTRALEGLLVRLDSPTGLAEAIGRRMLAGQEPSAITALVAQLTTITVDDVRTAAAHWIEPSRAFITLAGGPEALRAAEDDALGELEPIVEAR